MGRTSPGSRAVSGPDASAAPPLRIDCSPDFPAFLAARGAALALSTYETGKLFLIGAGEGQRLAVVERSFPRAMGLWAAPDGRRMLLATLFQLWWFADAVGEGPAPPGHDRLFVPQLAWTTGELDIHDIAVDRSGRVLFVATRTNCIATVSAEKSFVPLWKPPFVSRLVPEDRCHLNGLALVDGEPAFATAVAASDVTDGWRDRRRDGGVVIDLRADRILADGFSMPHSPRWHAGRLWLLDSGSGRLGTLDPATGRFEALAFCPGYARGLAFLDGHALVGLSLPRDRASFGDLPLEEELRARGAEARCGILVIELATGVVRHWLRFSGIVTELYDLAVLPATRRPGLVGLRGEDIRRVLVIDAPGPLFPGTAAGGDGAPGASGNASSR